MDHQGTKRLESDRLILRRFTVEDAEDMYNNWASDDEVTKYLTWPTHSSVEITKSLLCDWVKKYTEDNYYNWGIELRSTGELIGNISVVRIKEDISGADLGWCMGRKWWGQGFMPEAAKAIIPSLFKKVGFIRLAACFDLNNPKSGRVMQKIGMTYEGTFRKAGENNQGVIDEVWYSILKEEFSEDRSKFKAY